MLIRLIWVGKTRDPAAERWIAEYTKRIARFCPIEITEVRDAPGKGRRRAEREARELEGRLGERGTVVLLDEAGKMLTSHDFARFLETSLASHPAVSFVLGGAEGLGSAVAGRADLRLSLSRLTFPHDAARALLLEQIYRAFTILKGLPYHR